MGQAAVFLAAKVLKCSAPQVSYHEMESAFQMLQIWRENEGGLLAYLFDSEAESYVGGLKVLYWMMQYLLCLNISQITVKIYGWAKTPPRHLCNKTKRKGTVDLQAPM